ncbi:MAG: choice-of-anchor D domain-containing protein [Bacteroidetes bacterium]|nr:choice-of-anchor D domain-containing protein [Bacteroidota bacterium]
MIFRSTLVLVFFAVATLAHAQDQGAMWNAAKRWKLGIDTAPPGAQAVQAPAEATRNPRRGDNPDSPPNTPDIQVFNPSLYWQSENSIGVSFSNPNHLMVSTNGRIPGSNPVVHQPWAFSTDGGVTWPASMQSEDLPPNIIDSFGDPVAFFDVGGKAYYCTLGSPGGIYFVTTTDFGATWSARANADNLNSTNDDKQHAAADFSGTFPNNVYAAWTDFGVTGTPIQISRSTDRGVTWLPRVALPIGSNRGQGVHIAIGPNGEVYPMWAHYTTGTAEVGIGFAKSTDGGATYSTPAIVFPINGIRISNGAITQLNGTRAASFPYHDVDRSNGPRRGWIYVVVPELDVPTSGQADIYVYRSSDGGSTWSSRIKVNGPDVVAGRWQWMPSIAVDPSTGGITVSYYSFDSTASTTMANRYAAYSVDGGDTWDNWVVSDVRATWAPQGTPSTNTVYNGDYYETAAAGGKAWVLWTDRRSGATGSFNKAYIERIIYGENFGWIRGTVTNTVGGAPIQNVAIDFVQNVLQQSGTSDATGAYFAGAQVDTPGTTANLTLRARRFGFLDTTLAVTITRNDTLTRNFGMRPLDLVLTKASITFPPTPVPGSKLDSLTARNQFASPLTLSSLTTTNPDFAVSPTNVVIPAQDSVKIYVTYTPTLGGTDTGRVIVLSSSIYTPRKDVLLDGTAIGVPHFTASVDSLTRTLEGGTRDSVTFRMRNVGTTAGDFSARAIVYPRTNPGAAKVIPLTLEQLSNPAAANSAAQLDYVVPPNYENQSGGSTFNGQLANAARTYQYLIHDSLLTGLVGQRITAIRHRIPVSASAPWPASDVTITNYDIYLSGSVAPANRSLTFAQNIVGPQTQVRSGSLLIPAGSYPSGGNPNQFGPEITFDTPWQYTGGHLLVEFRHPGFTGTSSSVDGIATTNSAAGYGTAFSACWTGSYTGTSGSGGNFGILALTQGGGNWFSVGPTSGSVAMGDSVLMTARFDATDPDIFNNPGNYLGRVEVIATNSALADTLRVPSRLFVVPPPGPRASVDRDSLDFGDVEIDSSKALSVLVRNIGAAALNVTNITMSNPNFSANPTSFSLASLDTQRVTVRFTAPAPGATYTGTMQFVSNDALAPSIALRGRSIGIAHVVVSPDSFVFALSQGDSVNGTVTIRNTGLGELTYTSNVSGGHIGRDSVNVGTATTSLASSSTLMRGGVVNVATTVVLSEIKTWLTLTSPREIRFVVYENTTGTNYTKIFETSITSGTGGPLWYSSGPISVTLQAGKIYAIGAHWPGAAGLTYYYQLSSPVPVPIPFGTITSGLATSSAFPPPATITNTQTSTLYYTQLVTSSGQWVNIMSGASGTVASGDSALLGFRVRTGELGGGRSQAALVVNTNDPLAPIVNVPVAVDILTGVSSAGNQIPESFELSQNYPNPFNPATTIKFGLPTESRVKLTVYNLLGQEIITIADEVRNAGYFLATWDGTNKSGSKVSSGIYFYRMEATSTGDNQNFTSLKKMILLK